MQEISFIDRLIQGEFEKGVQIGEATLILKILKKKFGESNSRLERRIKVLPSKKLRKLAEDLLSFQSKKELTTWLKENS